MQPDSTAPIGAHRLAEGPLMPPPADPRLRRARRWVIRAASACAIVGALIAAHRPLLTGFARLFRVDDPAPSDALVLLLGGSHHRPVKAAELYRQGLAPMILMGESTVNERVNLNESKLASELLIRHGVPAGAIHILPGGVVTSTREEAMRVRDYARDHPIRRVTLVTTAFHTARARWIFRRVLRGTGIEVRAAAVAHPEFDESSWYTRDEGLVHYFDEAFKTVYYRIAY